MLNVQRLSRVAWGGIQEIVPAVADLLADGDRRQRLEAPFGANALASLAGLGAVAAVLGQWFARQGPNFPFKEHVHWGAAILAVALGVRIRRVLFAGPRPEARFSDLALSIAPALFALLFVSVVLDLIFGPGPAPHDGFADPSGIGIPLLAITQLAGVVAAVTIAVASLCYSRNWINALTDLGVRLFVFKLLIWITALILIEIGIVGVIVGAIIHALTGWRVPEWLSDLADQISYAILLLAAYGFVIGGTWRVCRETYSELLETGDVNVTKALETLAKDTKKNS